VAGPIYALTVALQLSGQATLDALGSVDDMRDLRMLEQVTALTKTFERPAILMRLVRSIQRLYPGLHIIVVDDSQHPEPVTGVQTVIMPYDSGLSCGRREGLRHVVTQYVLLLDDDFVLYRRTNLVAAVHLMEAHRQIDIMGGCVLNLPFYTSTDYRRGALFPTEATSTMPEGSLIGGLPVYDKVANFFLARTERLRAVNWDPTLKQNEHADFFTRAKGVLTTVYNQDLKCLHAPTPFDTRYMEKRGEHLADLAVLQRRYFGQ
jgi:glycosyltransferase involved in cell wall biosynthesis